MKTFALSKVKTKAEARQIAIDWQKWQSNHPLSYSEVIKWQEYFKSLAKRFELMSEFKENAII